MLQVSPEDQHLLRLYRWGLNKDNYWRKTNGDRILIHHAILGKPPRGMCIDHINHDLNDNRRENLRVVKMNQNKQNRRKPAGIFSSKYKGVCWEKSCSRWRAQISVYDNTINIGVFKDELSAARAYDVAAKQYYGEHACLNFPTDADAFSACFGRAKEIQQSVKEQYPNSEAVMAFGGDPPAPTTNESMDSILAAYTKHLPQLLQTTSAGILPTERAKLAATEEISPRTAELMYGLFSNYVPKLAAVGNQVNTQQRMSDAATEADILRTQGPQIAGSYLNIARQIDPQFFAGRQLQADRSADLLNSIKLTDQLTGGERAEIERYTNAGRSVGGMTGGAGGAGETAANAMLFGQASGNKLRMQQEALGNALNTAAQTMTAGRTGFDPVQAALGRPSTNAGVSQFTGIKPVGSEAFGMGANLLNTTGTIRGQENQINADRRDSLDRFSQVMGSMPNVSCCFIFMEAMNGPLPPYVRYWRDHFYTAEPDVAKGYKKMAKWLVPMMQKSSFVKSLVNELMVKPICAYGAYLSGLTNNGSQFKTFKTVWFAIWRTYARTK